MPQSKTDPRRAQKLKKRTQRAGEGAPVSYVYLLDVLRESLNKRFYEEQGFPHLEFLAQNWKGAEMRHGDLSDYLELQDMFIGFAYALSHAIHSGAPFSMEEREDHVAGVAYALAATLLNNRPDFHDDSGWMGGGVFKALRERWALPKMKAAGVPVQNRFMSDRELACLFAVDFVMSFLDMTGELAQMGGDKVISVTVCKDRLLTNYLGLVTSNLMLATEGFLDFDQVFAENAVTEDFLQRYPDWKPEAADDLNVDALGFNSLDREDVAFMMELMANGAFMSEMRELYVGEAAKAIPQGKREEAVMRWVLQYGPRCKKAFAAGHDPSEEDMDRDAEVVNGIIMQLLQANGEALTGAQEVPPEVAPAETTEAAQAVEQAKEPAST